MEPTFLADAMLGGLARWLRILGLDAHYDPELDDPELVDRAVAEDRLILTRDAKLVERRDARDRHVFIESEVVDEQVRQVLEDCDLEPRRDRWFSRCVQCNEPLEPMPTEEAHRVVPPFVARTRTEFRQCPGCQRIFWRSSHVRRMRRRLEEMGLSDPHHPTPSPKTGRGG